MAKNIHCPDCGCVIGGDVYSADPARRRYFAIIHESFQNLRPPWSEMFSSSEHLRKYALIKAGWCETMPIAAGNKAAAENVAEAIRKLNRYAIATTEGSVVTVYVARSQTRKVQPKALFMPCAEAVYRILSDMLGTSVEDYPWVLG